MKLDARVVVAPLVAFLVFAFAMQRTWSALRSSGAWRAKPKTGSLQPDLGYTLLDGLLARPLLELPADRQRDPFGLVMNPTPVAVRTSVPHVTPPPAPLGPVLTAIIFDSDPRATIRYDDREFSVRENTLFADFRVKTITSTEVVLERNGEALVLTLRSKGE